MQSNTTKAAYRHYASLARAKRANAAQYAAQHLPALRAIGTARIFPASSLSRAALNALHLADYIAPYGNSSTYRITGRGHLAVS